mgnify:FL=1
MQTAAEKIEVFEEQGVNALASATDERFKVKDLSGAEWCLKKISRAKVRYEEIKAYVESEKAKLDAFLADAKEQFDGDKGYFESLLMPYAMEQLEGQKKKKSIKLPSGTIGFKAMPAEIKKDDEALKAFVKESAPEFIETKETVKWGEFKKTLTAVDGRVITADGEIVDGVTFEEKPDVFYSKIN